MRMCDPALFLGGRNQILIERAKRVLEDEGLTQGPAGGVSEGMHSRAMQGRTMQVIIVTEA